MLADGHVPGEPRWEEEEEEEFEMDEAAVAAVIAMVFPRSVIKTR